MGVGALGSREVEGVAASTGVEERLAGLARGGGALRRVMAALAGQLVARRAFEPIGYARLGDYARERLGVSARTLQELARVESALGELPRLEAALVSGWLPWSKLRLVARFATAEDEANLIARAKRVPVRALERELRAVERGARGFGTEVADEAEPTARVVVSVPRRVAFKWQRTCRYAAQVAGETTPASAVLEWVTAEALATGAGAGAGARDDEGALDDGVHREVRPAVEPALAEVVVVEVANVCATQG